VRAIVEGSGAVPVPLAMGKAADSAGVAIEPGTQEIDATVTVTYDAG